MSLIYDDAATNHLAVIIHTFSDIRESMHVATTGAAVLQGTEADVQQGTGTGPETLHTQQALGWYRICPRRDVGCR